MVRSSVPLTDFADEFRNTGRQLMEHSEREFQKGDLLQASEKAWGAVHQFLKAVATERDWGHDTHSHVRQVAQNLAVETGNLEISDLFSNAEALHANFYQAHMDADTVRRHMDRMKRYVEILGSVPLPEAQPGKAYVRERPFFQSRNDSL
jgi:hypothetical protein